MLTHLVKFQVRLAQLRDDRSDRGATAVEYGLMVALIAGVIAVAVALIGTNLRTMFQAIAAQLD